MDVADIGRKLEEPAKRTGRGEGIGSPVFDLAWFRAAEGENDMLLGRGDEALRVDYKVVVLEGLEVVFIVVTFGNAGGELAPAAIGAALAGLLVLTVGVAIRRPLASVPENQLKFGVGLMLVSFGTFWAGEGIGIAWPGSDISILLLLAGYLATSLVAVRTVAAELVRSEQPSPMLARQEAK